jgi:D-aminopeptidase
MSGLPEPRPRLRECGLAVGRLPTGPVNAITDVPGVRVGHVTLCSDDGVCVRTGLTAVLPHDRNLLRHNVPAAVHVINAFGKATGTTQLDELGVLETPVVLTNTLSIGAAYTGLVRHALADGESDHRTLNPVVFECNDGWLNEIGAMRVLPEHVIAAIEGATTGRVAEGSVGAGTGMVCFGWKGGLGTASRTCDGNVIGALVLANFGARRDLRVDGVPVGERLAAGSSQPEPERVGGSCIVVLATDAPLDARQLRRLAARSPYSLGRTGSLGQHSSGDYAIAFATAEAAPRPDGPWLDALFQGAVEAVEEAILNALFVSDTVAGVGGHVAYGLPVRDVTRLVSSSGRE